MRFLQGSLGVMRGPWMWAVLLLPACGAEPASSQAARAPGATGPETRAPAALHASPAAPSPVEISIVGTNDLHGRIGKLPLFAGYVQALRTARPGRVALIDAGDMFQGTLESNLNEGAVVIDAYRKLGYSSATIGNHEFDYGPVGPAAVVMPGMGGDPRGALKARAAQAAGVFPLLAANLLEDGRPVHWPNVLPSVRVTAAPGVVLGIIGVTTMETPYTTIAANFKGLAVTPIAGAVAREARRLRDRGACIVVVAAHAGGECRRFDHPDDLSSCDLDSEIFKVARALPPGGVDMIVAGHTHQGVAHRVAGIPIIESYAYGKAFGRIDVTWDPAAKRVLSARIHPPVKIESGGRYEGTAVVPSDEIAQVIEPAIRKAAVLRHEPLGVTLTEPFEPRYLEESALGNLVASLMLQLDPRADVAIMNAGGLRAELPAGPLEYGSLYDALPFDNRPARVTMTGKNLAALLQKNLTGRHGIFSIAGARAEVSCGEGGLEVRLYHDSEQRRRGKRIQDDERIVVLTNDFLATGGDHFGAAGDVQMDEAAPPIRDSIASLLRKRGGVLNPRDWLRTDKPRISLPAGGRPFCSH